MRISVILLLLVSMVSQAQKKSLDHSVYDSWQQPGEKLLTANGQYLAYTINVQEGDGILVVRSTNGQYEKQIARGYQAAFSADGNWLVARIKPLFRETREARIKKKPAADMPKDSLLILDLVKDSMVRIPGVLSYKMPQRGHPWLAYHLAKTAAKASPPDSLAQIRLLALKADSLSRVADSLRLKLQEARQKGLTALQPAKKEDKSTKNKEEKVEEGTDLVLVNLARAEQSRFGWVNDYQFNKFGQVLLVETSRRNGVPDSEALLLRFDLEKKQTDTILRRFNDAKSYALTEDGSKMAFVAERDSSVKSLRKFYSLYLYETGMDTAVKQAGAFNGVLPKGWVVSPDFNNYFSKDGRRLFFGTAPQPLVKDTSLVDFETAKLDIWNYKDDYLQPQQLVQVNNELKRSYLTVLQEGKITRLAMDSMETVTPSAEGNGRYALGTTSAGYRIQQQWSMDGSNNIFLVNLENGTHTLIAKGVRGAARLSPLGNYVYWYDRAQRHWMVHDNNKGTTSSPTRSIGVPLYDEDDDHPDFPPPHGVMGWLEKDAALLVYDKYDIWQCDPSGNTKPVCITNGEGRKNKITIRYVNTDPEARDIKMDRVALFSLFDHGSKGWGWETYQPGEPFRYTNGRPSVQHAFLGSVVKAREAEVLLFERQTPASVNLFQASLAAITDSAKAVQVSRLNPQQQQYNWFTVELMKWKMLDGKMSEGLLYKPENFDPSKKYPVIFYFYEKNADNRFRYIEPMPVRASVNIAYYTSNGYIVFDPNIYYKTGQPGEDAYNSVVSAARHLSRFSWVDSTRLGLQGHSWGGYQVAYLVTRTNMFAAAESGAPVSNMTSAYGGIRWGTGLSRQFQYEKTQSRLGATLWEKPERYIVNSPLFKVDKIKTPVLILHNDQDDAVPWYQGIELFTAMRRLGKPVWMINYNDEKHGITERRNRKDWTIRMAQFFDHYLKGSPAPRWMTEGVPATRKGIDWGIH